MTNWPIRLVAGVGLLILMAGCSSLPKFETEVSPAFRPEAYRTYFMLPVPTEDALEHRLPEFIDEFAKLAELAVDSAMAQKGYRPAASMEAADMVILIHGEITPKSLVLLDQSFNPSTIRPGASIDQSLTSRNPGVTHRRDYDEGRLVVEIHDAKTEQMLWVSWFEREMAKTERPPAERVAGNVALLLESLPGRS